MYNILIMYLSLYVFIIGSMIIYLTNISIKYGKTHPGNIRHINKKVIGAAKVDENHKVYCYVDRIRNKNIKIPAKNSVSYMILKEYLGQKKRGIFVR